MEIVTLKKLKTEENNYDSILWTHESYLQPNGYRVTHDTEILKLNKSACNCQHEWFHY